MVATHSIEQMALRRHRRLTEFVQGALVPESDSFTFAKIKPLLDNLAING